MTTDTPLDAFAFLRQLESNARTIASAKRGSARSEWTEDADEFARAIAAATTLERELSECRAALRDAVPLVSILDPTRTAIVANLDDQLVAHAWLQTARAILAKGEGK